MADKLEFERLKEEEREKMYTPSSFLFAILVSIVYLLLSILLVGFRGDQVTLIVIFNALYFLNPGTRRFIKGFSIFIIYWIIFDYQKAFPNYLYNDVHIQSLYETEKSLFGFNYNGSVITPNEYFLNHHNPVVDFISGLFYLGWVPVPFGFAAILLIKRSRWYKHFVLGFILVNIIGWAGYYGFPAAPPWYVQEYGFAFKADTPGNVAGLARFDELTGIPVFSSIYSKSSNVFAAMPSLHSAYILLVAVFSWMMRSKWFWFHAMVTLGIWFTAVYSSHHYTLDVLAGITCTLVAIAVYKLFLPKKWVLERKEH